jgi:hypothetical protein
VRRLTAETTAMLPGPGLGVCPYPPPVPRTDHWPMNTHRAAPPDSRGPCLLSSDDGDPAAALNKLPEFMFSMAPSS